MDNHILKFKEKSPKETLEYIFGILEEVGIEYEEAWLPVSDIGTYSLRVTIKGTNIGSNGKGMTEEYARASAFAEFVERLQNFKTAQNHTYVSLFERSKFEFLYFPEEKYLSAEELIDDNSAYIKMFMERRKASNASRDEKIAAFQKSQKMDYNISRERNKYLCIPFYSLRENKTQYLPYMSFNTYYGSNGMCAGNTQAEALVQGMSEICERIAHRRIMTERPSFPDIPESYLKKFPEIYNMYQLVKENKDYEVFLKDCSFGGKYPVAGLYVIEKNTGRYGLKLGAHPDYGIAMERVFTEATQGVTIKSFSQKSFLDFTNRGVSSNVNIVNGFKTSDANYPYELILSPPTYKFTEAPATLGKTNSELLENMLRDFLNDGHDILIHDCSYLGFPSYHIIIPGQSEMNLGDDSAFEGDNTRFHVKKLLNNPEHIDKNTVKYVISVLNYYSNNLLENTMRDHTGIFSSYDYPGRELGIDYVYMTAMCYAFLEDYEQASRYMSLFVGSVRERGLSLDKKYLIVYHYFFGMIQLKRHDYVMEYLESFFDADLIMKIDDIFKDPSKILVKQYPKVNLSELSDEAKEICKELLLYEDAIIKLKKKQKENLIDQNHFLDDFKLFAREESAAYKNE